MRLPGPGAQVERSAGAEHFPPTAVQDGYEDDAENLGPDVSACDCRMHEHSTG